ncbi:MAG TPA: di-trans,poly-cis-decaprenylcistransferase [Helicobacteraceae bacterium]|nr:di-trans,poly-cis-decaprenylcistransferase [Helicobacteraceae bacterium]
MSATHLAIIMDGNGRWAKQQGLSRTEGHKVGAEKVREMTTYCSKQAAIKQLTLYAFSTENWKRPKLEVEFLMKLLSKYLKNETEVYLQNGVKFQAIGDISRFSNRLKDEIQALQNATARCTQLTQYMALNYGAHDEICRAANQLVQQNSAITPESLQAALDQPHNVDLLIRTGNEQRLSNFLLWQCVYAEFFFTPTLWPDFTTSELETMLNDFGKRERRFGAISAS